MIYYNPEQQLSQDINGICFRINTILTTTNKNQVLPSTNNITMNKMNEDIFDWFDGEGDNPSPMEDKPDMDVDGMEGGVKMSIEESSEQPEGATETKGPQLTGDLEDDWPMDDMTESQKGMDDGGIQNKIQELENRIKDTDKGISDMKSKYKNSEEEKEDDYMADKIMDEVGYKKTMEKRKDALESKLREMEQDPSYCVEDEGSSSEASAEEDALTTLPEGVMNPPKGDLSEDGLGSDPGKDEESQLTEPKEIEIPPNPFTDTPDMNEMEHKLKKEMEEQEKEKEKVDDYYNQVPTKEQNKKAEEVLKEMQDNAEKEHKDAAEELKAIEKEHSEFAEKEEGDKAKLKTLPKKKIGLSDVRSDTPIKQRPPIIKNDKTKFTSAYHFMLIKCLKYLKVKDADGYRTPLFLWGGTGCGKSKIARQLSEITGLKLYQHNFGPTTTESKVEGYTNFINGEMVIGWMYKPYRYGGILDLEEIDLADPGVAAFMNTPISETEFEFPDGELVKKHKNFVLIATANTNGTGSFGGFIRNRIDCALLDRYLKIHMDYDESLEDSVSNLMVAKVFRAARKYCDNHSIQVAVTMRSMITASRLYDEGACKKITELSSLTWAHQMEEGQLKTIIQDITKTNLGNPVN